MLREVIMARGCRECWQLTSALSHNYFSAVSMSPRHFLLLPSVHYIKPSSIAATPVSNLYTATQCSLSLSEANHQLL